MDYKTVSWNHLTENEKQMVLKEIEYNYDVDDYIEIKNCIYDITREYIYDYVYEKVNEALNSFKYLNTTFPHSYAEEVVDMSYDGDSDIIDPMEYINGVVTSYPVFDYYNKEHDEDDYITITSAGLPWGVEDYDIDELINSYNLTFSSKYIDENVYLNYKANVEEMMGDRDFEEFNVYLNEFKSILAKYWKTIADIFYKNMHNCNIFTSYFNYCPLTDDTLGFYHKAVDEINPDITFRTNNRGTVTIENIDFFDD